MSESSTRVRPLRSLGFLHISPFSPENPGVGLKETLELFSYAEDLGFNSGWVRTRHMQYGAPAPAVMMAALAQATDRLRIGNAVIPLEYENPFTLAENLSVADLLSGGRLYPGVSVHPPRYAEAENATIFGAGWSEEDYSYGRIEKLLDLIRGEDVRTLDSYQGFGGDLDSTTVQPLSPGLAERFYYGAGSLRSASWAGEHGLGLLVSNISTSENNVMDFNEAQAAQMRAYLAAHQNSERARISQARVVVPVENASEDQLHRYREYVEARTPRTRGLVGERILIAPDILGTTEQIVNTLQENPSFALADEFIFELPFEMGMQDWKHMLHEYATRIGPALGWTPSR